MKKSQTKKILDYLVRHKKGLSPLEALIKYGCYRLASRINELRSNGYLIITEMEQNKTTGSRYARYFMK